MYIDNNSNNNTSNNGSMNTLSNSLILALADWSAYHNYQEFFDACGEIFEARQMAISLTSPIGIRLQFFGGRRLLDRLKIRHGVVVGDSGGDEEGDSLYSPSEVELRELQQHLQDLKFSLDAKYQSIFDTIEQDILFQIALSSLLNSLRTRLIENGKSSGSRDVTNESLSSSVQIRNRILEILKSVERILDASPPPSLDSQLILTTTMTMTTGSYIAPRAFAWQQLVDAASPDCSSKDALRKASKLREGYKIVAFVDCLQEQLRHLEHQCLATPTLSITFESNFPSEPIIRSATPAFVSQDWSIEQRHHDGPYKSIVQSSQGADSSTAPSQISTFDSPEKIPTNPSSPGFSPERSLRHRLTPSQTSTTSSSLEREESSFPSELIKEESISGTISPNSSMPPSNTLSNRDTDETCIDNVHSPHSKADSQSAVPVSAVAIPVDSANQIQLNGDWGHITRALIGPNTDPVVRDLVADDENQIWLGAKRARSDLASYRATATRVTPVLDSDDDDSDYTFEFGRSRKQLFNAKKPKPRTRWSFEEEQALREGFDKYGNRWADIKLDPLFADILATRTNVNLKDKARQLELRFA